MTYPKQLIILGLAVAAVLGGVPPAHGADYASNPKLEVVVTKVPVAGPAYCYKPLRAQCGGGGSGCWNVRVGHAESHWYGWWDHVFQVSWCSLNGRITSSHQNAHYQGSSGAYGTRGASPAFVASGCVGCNHIRWDAQARYTFTAWWPPFYTSHFDDWIRITLYPSGTVG